jgi:hypothetical protein
LSLLGPSIYLSILLSNTLNLCSSLNVRDQVSHPYKMLPFLQLSILTVKPSGVWSCVVQQSCINILEEPSASIFESFAQSMGAAGPSKTLMCLFHIIWRQKPKNSNQSKQLYICL